MPIKFAIKIIAVMIIIKQVQKEPLLFEAHFVGREDVMVVAGGSVQYIQGSQNM